VVRINTINLIGRLTSEPILKFIPSSGTGVCNFTLAVDKGLSKQKKEEFSSQGKDTADFIPIIVFGKIAESCANYLAKGKKVAVMGSIQTRNYQNKDGNKVYITEVLANKVEFIDWQEPKQSSDIFEPFDSDESMPF